ncbi:hypothetical protein QFC19_000759 [Naganishia cerealis]|uniref:Uncharacterized protein n=1 Tax=Naganishia cerealis TaxID=610337 RepID=A0ACC2WM93_9TREE|nr:hypothetical protein QFC19_000759 [Naganishia cerealis]
MPVSLLSLPAELLLESCYIADALRHRLPSSLLREPAPSFVGFQLPPTLTPNSAPFTPLGAIAGEHIHTTTTGSDYFGVAGHDAEGFVLGSDPRALHVATTPGSERDFVTRPVSSALNAVDVDIVPQREARNGTGNLQGGLMSNQRRLTLPVAPNQRRSSARLLNPPNTRPQNPIKRRETLHSMSCICKELRSTLWPLLSNSMTLDLPKIQEILRSPTKYTFASGVRHLQVNLYPPDLTSLGDISAFLAIINTHLYSLRFRFHPLSRYSNPNAPMEAGSTNREPDSSTPFRKVFHLPRVRQVDSGQGIKHAPTFPHLVTLGFRGFGAISTLETSILQEAPTLGTLDIASHPLYISRTFDLVETLHSSCPALRNLRLEIDSGFAVNDLTPYTEYVEYGRTNHRHSEGEVLTLLHKIFSARTTSGIPSSTLESAADESCGSFSNLRKVDILSKGLRAVVTLEQWDALAKAIISTAPQLRSLTLPITPESWFRFKRSDNPERGEGIDHMEARPPGIRNILSRIVNLDANSRIDSLTKAAEDSSQFVSQRVGSSGEVLPDLDGSSHGLQHLEYLEFKLYSRPDRKLYDPLIHVDDHPFHSRVLPAERKVDVDPGRDGAWVPQSAATVITDENTLHSSRHEPGSQQIRTRPMAQPVMRWQSNGKLLGCEVYKVWSASFDRNHASSKPLTTPLGEYVAGQDGNPMQDVVMEHNGHFAGHDEAEGYKVEIKTRMSVHQRW